jgi:hypothetical protein
MTNDDIIRMALKAGATIRTDCDGQGLLANGIDVEEFAALVAAAEREECAKVCETYNKRQPYNDEDMVIANECAFAIRERGAP